MKLLGLILPALMLLSACSETDPDLQIPPANEVQLDLAPGRIKSANLYGWSPPQQQLYITPTVPVSKPISSSSR